MDMILDVANTGNFDYIIFAIIVVLMIISMLIVYTLYMQNKQLINELNKKNNIEEDKEQLSDAVTTKVEEVFKEKDEMVNKDETNQEMVDLQNITKDLENKQNEKTIDFTSYEAEQEEKAIISYDELLEASKKVSINYSEEKNIDDVLVKKVDLDNTGKIELDPIKKELNSKVELVSYEHEEDFLKALKQLQSLLN